MFEIDQWIYYSQIGVCRVEKIGVPDFLENEADPPLYYFLQPYKKTGTVFVPVSSDVYMRPVMDADEVNALIDSIPTISCELRSAANLQSIAQIYSEKMRSHDARELVSLILAICNKKKQRLAHNQRIGSIDETYLKRATGLLHGEFALALGIDEENVPAYIESRVGIQF